MILPISIFVLFVIAASIGKVVFLRSDSSRQAISRGYESPPQLTSRWNILGTIMFYNQLFQAARNGEIHTFVKSLFSTASGTSGYEVKTLLLPRPWRDRVLTIDAENIHAILTTRNQDFNTGTRKHAFEPALGRYSIFGSDGEEWKHSRRMIRSALSRERISDTSIIHKNTASLINLLASTNGPLDIQPLFEEHTMRTSTQFLGLGTPDQAGVDHELYQALELCNIGSAIRASLDRLYWLYNTVPFRKACLCVHTVVKMSVKRVMALNDDPDERTRIQFMQREKRNLLEDFVMETRDEERLLSMALDVLGAGRQTTASLLSSLLYYLAQNPTTYSKLRFEVVQAFGPTETDDLITFEQLKRCQFLQYCLNETLRLIPSALFGNMTAAVDTSLPTGGGAEGRSPIFLRKGTVVAWNFALLHTDKGVWGADADAWRPDRFEGRKNTKGFLPFNAGARTCPGQQFALTSAAYALVRICQRFVHIESLTGASTPRMTYGLAQMHMDGVKVQFATSNPTHLSSSAHHPLPLPSPPVAREKLRGGNNILGKALEWLIMPYFGREMMQLGIGDAEW